MKIGIMGTGQLAQLLAHSAYQLGLHTLCFGQTESPAARLSPIFTGDETNETQLIAFAKQCDVITLENENIALETIQTLSQHTLVYPNADAIASFQDRLFEKQLFQSLGIPTVPFAAIHSLQDCQTFIQSHSLPVIIKSRRFGYDGKGQAKIQTEEEIETAWQSIQTKSAILEAYFPFDFEVSLLSVRNIKGEMRFYPLIHNTHKEGILRLSRFPFIDSHLQAQAEAHAKKVMEKINYIGVMAFEFFAKNQVLYANEIAPRVHNSGHLTIEGSTCSQFENHLRAVADLPLIQAQPIKHSAMFNIIGVWPNINPNALGSGVHLYDYGKTPRPGRKLGHITLHTYEETHLVRLINEFSSVLSAHS